MERHPVTHILGLLSLSPSEDYNRGRNKMPMLFQKKILSFLVALTVLATPYPGTLAADVIPLLAPSKIVTRGEIVSRVVKAFDLRKKNADFIASCLSHPDECFFVFMAMSRFDDIGFKPLILYPDVSIAYRYYDDINVASMLGLIHGYIHEKSSPFYPRAGMTRIEALKVILTAADMIIWKEKFELVAELGDEMAVLSQKTVFKDIDASGFNWWYPRYVNAGTGLEIIDESTYFRPDEIITEVEFSDMLERALALHS